MASARFGSVMPFQQNAKHLASRTHLRRQCFHWALLPQCLLEEMLRPNLCQRAIGDRGQWEHSHLHKRLSRFNSFERPLPGVVEAREMAVRRHRRP